MREILEFHEARATRRPRGADGGKEAPRLATVEGRWGSRNEEGGTNCACLAARVVFSFFLGLSFSSLYVVVVVPTPHFLFVFRFCDLF